MYINSVTSAAKPGQARQAAEFAIEIAAKVTSVTGTNVGVYSALYGAPAGSLLWSSRVDSLAQLGEFTDKLDGDAGFQKLALKGPELLASPPASNLLSVVSSTLTPSPKRFYSSTQAVIANGKIAEAVAFGVEAQTHIAKAGFATAFGTSMFGAYGAVTWLVGADTMAQLDSVQAFMSTDAVFLAMLPGAAELFIEGSGVNGLIKKIN